MGPTVRKFYEEMQRGFEAIKAVEAEIAALVKQRADVKRFLDIDAEQAELARLQGEKAGILAEATAERDRMLGQARTESDGILTQARETAEQVAAGIVARANEYSDTVRGEARAVVTAAQGEARSIVTAAQGQARQLLQEAQATQDTAEAIMLKARTSADALAAREVAVSGREKAVGVAERDLEQQKDALRASLAR